MRFRHVADPRTSTRPGRGRSLLAGTGFLLLVTVLLPPPAASHAAEGAPPGAPAAIPGTPATEPGFDDLMPGARVTSGFGPRRHPVDGTPVHHDGVDLSTGEESPVFAPPGGVVEVAAEGYGQGGRFGTVVIVDHGSGVKTFYAHLARLSVEVGQGLRDGDPIGHAGNTGVSSGPHLHFELWKDGESVDPGRMAEVLGGF